MANRRTYDLMPDFISGGLVEDLVAISIILCEISVFATNNIESEVDKLMAKFELNDSAIEMQNRCATLLMSIT